MATAPLLFAAACMRAPDAPRESPAFTTRNLLMISVDTLRKDHVSRYDPKGRNLTPFLDTLMSEGVVADDHRSCSNWTFQATACALGGRSAAEMGQFPLLGTTGVAPWDDAIEFLPDLLGAAGFDATLAAANGWLVDAFRMTDGYDHTLVESFLDATELRDQTVEHVEAAIAADPDARWFWHLHLMEPHQPYVPPDEYRIGEDALDPLPWDIDTQESHYDVTVDLCPTMTPEEQALLAAHLAVRYDGELRWLDDQIRGIVEDVDARGWLEDTLVVVWSDHGEQFWEHGQQTHAWHLYGEENDALFFAWARGLAPEDVDRPTSHVDIAPTVLEWLGLPVAPEMTGTALQHLDASRPMFASARGRLPPMHAVERDRKKLVYQWDGHAFYYDLAADPGALYDRFDATSPEVQALWALLAPEVRAATSLVPTDAPIEVPGLPL